MELDVQLQPVFFLGPPGEAPGPMLLVFLPSECRNRWRLRGFLQSAAVLSLCWRGAGAATASRPATAPRCSGQTADRGSHDSCPGTSDLTSRDQ